MARLWNSSAKRAALGAASLVALACLATPAAAAECGDLADLDIGEGRVTSASLIEAGEYQPPASPFGAPPGVAGSPYAALPAFCRIEATLTPTSDSEIRVEIWMPAENWNGKFVGIGNGVWAGVLSISQLVEPLSRGYATATTNAGHDTGGMSGQFAAGHPEKLIDFGHRAVHEMTVTAKTAIEAYYGSGPTVSLWNSCSTGGRQGLMSAYRYPEDYDVISAMAPANPMTDLMTQSMFAGFYPPRTPENTLTPQLLQAIHQAALRECDDDDGLVDGVISRPDACAFEPRTLSCKQGESGNCLTPGQLATIENIYRGIVDPQSGAQLLPGWPIGSEVQLSFIISGNEPFPVAFTYFDLLVHGGDEDWDWTRMDFPREVYLAREFGSDALDVPYTGLNAFFARGGKLLMSHGWTDGLIPATNALKFYSGLYYAIPLEQAQNQLRLFMVPGMDHCAGGAGASQFDTLAIIDEWDATGQAPNRLVARRPGGPAGGPPGAPAGPSREPITRPLCPYPLYPAYSGEGDESDEASFTCANPS
ncbi:MAG TPA: tannase/feruloyl esterase family alpha/beta hydrolase [Sphingomonadaceae bacterium]|nr:tannase/feruloyl esterase family alpha/beta hydrolase [Sphingomonadaceae bacterium]